ncbi:AMP-binding protein [Massilia sp. G4R7]|uniref:Long-chain-fatty-acid--CoA ligase n=1 Tax=Massilia phyllostachyos TaxID=2898585 RepID=A0ABS8QDE1_9BURK|nr:AMP-binding protein [Massilia phyllostachyos]MCD2519639.1 AMP-binding protein [Massilia phyllostachyos]
MEKIWLRSYPPGVPAEVALDPYPSLPAMLEHVSERFGDRPAFDNLGATLSWFELDTLSRQFAAWLHAAGLRKGDRVAIMLPNLLQYPVALFGAFRAGCAVVNVNPLYTARELRHQLADSGASAIVVLENFAHTLQQVLPSASLRHVVTTRVGDLLPFPKAQIVNLVVRHVRHMVPDWRIDGAVKFPEALARGATLSRPPAAMAPDAADIALLQYTGGTTGVPKGAILSHGNIVANIAQITAWIRATLDEGRETVVLPLPLYHVFALTAMLTFAAYGARIVLITNPRDIRGFVRELRHTKFTVLVGVNTLFNALLDAPGMRMVDLRRVKLAVAGGMALQRTVAERWHALSSRPLIEGYGLTETSPFVCANPLNAPAYTGTVGLPIPSTEVALLDDAGVEVPQGEAGEVCVRGPQVMRGYWNMPGETAHVFTQDGWLRTGDVGILDAGGFVRVVDRKKDVIIVSAFKVFPNEVEDVAAMHPGVLEVAAIPARDAQGTETVKLVVVRRDPGLSAEDLIDHCRRHLAPYKVPRLVAFRTDALPKSNIGKILRRVVVEEDSGAARGRSAPAPAG